MLLLLAAMVLLHRLHPPASALGAIGTPIGVLLLALGFAGLVGARLQFRRSASEIMTFAQPRNMVTSGLFRFSRNPMYLSMLIILVGAAATIDLWCALAAPLLFFAAANWWYIPFEERAAALAFGDEYLSYRQHVRRWL
jgi:protein-S-isoprenylcysteine O-methyltransferase Ste14